MEISQPIAKNPSQVINSAARNIVQIRPRGKYCRNGWNITIIIRPHRSTVLHTVVYFTAAYCYRLSRVIYRSVGRSVAIVSPAITAEPIEMPFGMWIGGQGSVY